jgi:hypothetical protein
LERSHEVNAPHIKNAMVLWVNDPPAAISSCRTDSLLRPNQKCCNSTWFGIDKSGIDLDRIEK